MGCEVGAQEELWCWLVLCHLAGLLLKGVSENEELPGCAAAPQASLNTHSEPKPNSVTCVSLWPAACFVRITKAIKINK